MMTFWDLLPQMIKLTFRQASEPASIESVATRKLALDRHWTHQDQLDVPVLCCLVRKLWSREPSVRIGFEDKGMRNSV